MDLWWRSNFAVESQNAAFPKGFLQLPDHGILPVKMGVRFVISSNLLTRYYLPTGTACSEPQAALADGKVT